MKELFSEIPCICGDGLELRRLELCDAEGLRALTGCDEVYRYLPTFLFEKQSADAVETIRRMYTQNRNESLILGVFSDGGFCGLAEFYGYRAPLRKISVGYRLLPQCWGEGDRHKDARSDGRLSLPWNRCEDHHGKRDPRKPRLCAGAEKEWLSPCRTRRVGKLGSSAPHKSGQVDQNGCRLSPRVSPER